MIFTLVYSTEAFCNHAVTFFAQFSSCSSTTSVLIDEDYTKLKKKKKRTSAMLPNTPAQPQDVAGDDTF